MDSWRVRFTWFDCKKATDNLPIRLKTNSKRISGNSLTPFGAKDGNKDFSAALQPLPGSLRSDIFEQHTSTESGLFAPLSCDFEQTFRQVVSIRVKTLSHTNLVASMYITEEKS